MQRDDKIYFPDDEDKRFTYEQDPRFKPVITKDCTKTFCEESDYYPKDYIENVIRNRILQFGDFIGKDEVQQQPNITQRIDANDETPLCQSVEKVVFPTSAENKNNEWFFIVNGNGLEQGVRVEKCM